MADSINTIRDAFIKRVQGFLDLDLVPISKLSDWAVDAPQTLGLIMQGDKGFTDANQAKYLACLDGILAAHHGLPRKPPAKFLKGGIEAERFFTGYDRYTERQAKRRDRPAAE